MPLKKQEAPQPKEIKAIHFLCHRPKEKEASQHLSESAFPPPFSMKMQHHTEKQDKQMWGMNSVTSKVYKFPSQSLDLGVLICGAAMKQQKSAVCPRKYCNLRIMQITGKWESGEVGRGCSRQEHELRSQTLSSQASSPTEIYLGLGSWQDIKEATHTNR